MKKYVKPTIETISENTTNSLLEMASGTGGSILGDSNGVYSSTGGINVGARHNKLWDDEDDEDF